MSDVPQITQNFGRPSYRPAAPVGGLDPDMRRMAIVAAGFGGVLALVIGLLFDHVTVCCLYCRLGAKKLAVGGRRVLQQQRKIEELL